MSSRAWRRALQAPIVSRTNLIRIPNHGTIEVPRRCFNSRATATPPSYAFAFDIDGVILRSKEALPNARTVLRSLQSKRIPFVFLTNGGGKKEDYRLVELSKATKVHLDNAKIVQSHTPLRELVNSYKSKTVLVVGGDGDRARKVAKGYGFGDVLIPRDFTHFHPDIWPFFEPPPGMQHMGTLNRMSLAPRDMKDVKDRSRLVKIDAIMVFTDPRDWGFDTQIILDLLLSHQGYLGSISSKNGDPSLPNCGYQQDGQPPLYFTNPDFYWATGYHLPRLGQGGYVAAFEGVWRTVTGGEKAGVSLQKIMMGKPHKNTFEYAENMLLKSRESLYFGNSNIGQLRDVYMIGDNPESDILGANTYGVPVSPRGVRWHSILVRSGVYSGGTPAHEPEVIVDGVEEAVQWAMEQAKAKR